jgi:hypothetical protein
MDDEEEFDEGLIGEEEIPEGFHEEDSEPETDF